MTANHTKGINGKMCGILIFTVLLIAIPAFFFDFYYDLNDDTMIKDILSGAYTGEPSAYCIQMLYPLSYFIAMLYRVIPILPWYGLFLCTCQFGVFIIIAWRLMSITKSRITTVAALAIELLVIFGLFLREIVIIQYSVTSGICMAGAVFLFVTSENSKKPSIFIKRNIVPVLLVVLSFMIRTEVCIMLLPFLLLAGLVYWSQENKIFSTANIKKYMTVILCALFGILVAFSLDKLAYSKNGWGSFMDFFDARTDVYDFYGIPSYDDNKAFYANIGLSRESFTLLENYNFALDDSLDSWRLEAISQYQKQKAYNNEGLKSTLGFVSKNSIGEAVWLYKEHFLSGFKALMGSFFENSINTEGAITAYAVIGSYVIYFLLCFFSSDSANKKQYLLKMAAVFIVRSILWLYLYMVDRVLGRVTVPLIMMELSVLIGFTLKDLPEKETINGSKEEKLSFMFNGMTNIAVIIMSVLFLTAALSNNIKAVEAEYANRLTADERWNALIEYCRSFDNSYYVIDVYSSTSYKGTPHSEKIFKNVDNSYKNFDICGGWAVKSPVFEQKLKKEGIKSIKTALADQKSQVMFVSQTGKDLTWIVEFYKKYGQTVVPKAVDTIKISGNEVVFEVYRLVTH